SGTPEQMATQVDPKADAGELEQLGLVAPQQPSMADRHYRGLRPGDSLATIVSSFGGGTLTTHSEPSRLSSDSPLEGTGFEPSVPASAVNPSAGNVRPL